MMQIIRSYWPRGVLDTAFEGLTICYGDGDWPSYSRWVVPGTWSEE